MKRIISLIIVIVAAFMFTIPLSAAEKGIVKVDVYINGEKLQTTDTPRIINDTTYVPLRAVCELFGADDISWDGRTNTAKIKARDRKSTRLNSSHTLASRMPSSA